jgi:hypothetical protein
MRKKRRRQRESEMNLRPHLSIGSMLIEVIQETAREGKREEGGERETEREGGVGCK